MIQRTLLRTLRQAQPAVRQSSTFSAPSRTLRAAAPALSASRSSSHNSPLQRRWYADDAKKEETKADTAEAAKDDAAAAKPQEEDPVRKELEAKKKEVIDLTDRVKRSVAEYRNLQDQTKREVQSAKDFALQRFAKDLLDTIDNLDRALSVVPAEKLASTTTSSGSENPNQDLINLHSGLKMTEDILMGTLKKHGLERFDPTEVDGGKFDPNRMEATFQAPQQGKEDGTVFYTQSKGFLLNGRVLRAAKVGVVKNS
nr:grpe protein like, mitochondrial [Quercus suber]